MANNERLWRWCVEFDTGTQHHYPVASETLANSLAESWAMMPNVVGTWVESTALNWTPALDRRLFFVVRGAPHPFDAPNYSSVQIIGWHFGQTALEAATMIAETDARHAYYTAFTYGDGEQAQALYVPGFGVDPDPPETLIG